MSVWREMLQGDRGEGSASNAGFLLSVIVLSICTIYATIYGNETVTLGMSGLLAAQTGGTKVFNKISDASVQRAKENPPPVPIAALGPTTIMNVGQTTEKKEGDV